MAVPNSHVVSRENPCEVEYLPCPEYRLDASSIDVPGLNVI
jgi:hypothetical protein